MAHTNETVNYRLSQFVGTDIPNPLVDYNGDMEKIDTAIKNVADSAVSEGGRITALETQNGSEVLTTTAQTLSGAVNELDGEVGGLDTRLTTAEGKIVGDESTLATAVGNISTLSGKVSGLETKVGSAVLTTTASDCSGAINELDAEDGVLGGKITALETQNGSEVLQTVAQTLSGAINELYNAPASGVTATDVSFDGTTSSLVATNVQSAIDEVVTMIPSSLDADDITYDNTTSGLSATDVQGAIDELGARKVTLRATSGTGTIGQQIAQLENTYDALSLEEKVGSFIIMNDVVIFRMCELSSKLFNNSRNVSTYFYNDTLGLGGTYIRANFVAGGTTSVTDNSTASATDGFFKLYA